MCVSLEWERFARFGTVLIQVYASDAIVCGRGYKISRGVSFEKVGGECLDRGLIRFVTRCPWTWTPRHISRWDE